VAEIARGHSEDIAAGRVPLGHEGLQARAREVAQTIGLSGLAENVCFNADAEFATARTAVSWWLGSAGHRKNLEGDYDLTGVGIAQNARGTYYYTQIFVRTREGSTSGPASPD
jgi:uncharacterized protein YkwD